jgi:hypothetical protein
VGADAPAGQCHAIEQMPIGETAMSETRRVIVTQNNAAGKSSVLEDRQVEASTVGVFNFWETRRGRDPDDVAGRGASSFTFFPEAGGTQFRFFTIPPADGAMPPEQVKAIADQFFSAIGWDGARRDTSRHPFMHTTPTLDYILLLSGEISLLLDEGDPIPMKPFDAVVQRGTNHSWVNTGKTTALLVAVMVGEQ